MAAILSTADVDIKNNGIESIDTSTVPSQPEPEDISLGGGNQAKDQSPVISAVNGTQNKHAYRPLHVDEKPYTPTGFKIQDGPLDDNPPLKVSSAISVRAMKPS